MKLKIGNIEQELKFMNKLYMENRFSEIVIRGQILNKKFPNIVPFYNILGLSYVKIGKDLLASKIFENGLFDCSSLFFDLICASSVKVYILNILFTISFIFRNTFKHLR